MACLEQVAAVISGASAAALTLIRADRLPRLQVAVPTASMSGMATDGWGRKGECFGFSTRPACVAMIVKEMKRGPGLHGLCPPDSVSLPKGLQVYC